MFLNFQSTIAALVASAILALAQAPGYGDITPSILPNDTTLSFGQHYAVLNLDLIEGLVAAVNTTAAGQSFINNTANWINTVHQQCPPPLSIFTRIYFSNAMLPEVTADTPFQAAICAFGNITASSALSQLHPAFVPLPDYDVVLQKTRYYAGASNGLEEILSSQGIDTVVIVSGHQFRVLW